MIFNFISFFLILLSISLILDIRIKPLLESTFSSLTKNVSLHDRISVKDNSFTYKLRYKFKHYEYILSLYNQKNVYKLFIILSFIFAIIGIFISITLNNIFLILGLSILFAYIPIFIMDKICKKKEEDLFSAFETFITLLYPSYTRTYDILKSIEININHIKNTALKNIFTNFIFECKSISPNIQGCIYNLKTKLNFDVYKKFCDFISESLDNKSEIHKLSNIIDDISTIKKNNEKMKNNIKGIKLEYYMITSLLVLNYPIIYVLNKDWFTILYSSLIGKIFTSIIVLYIAISSIYLDTKLKNIGYERRA